MKFPWFENKDIGCAEAKDSANLHLFKAGYRPVTSESCFNTPMQCPCETHSPNYVFYRSSFFTLALVRQPPAHRLARRCTRRRGPGRARARLWFGRGVRPDELLIINKNIWNSSGSILRTYEKCGPINKTRIILNYLLRPNTQTRSELH